mmetsp:Transcript_11311/g.26586  ORF Transcript_11311/g.26586 Transcript_11311/m.26586 type:complete len:220 (-) Transcript_11311:1124-1783(-)
MTHRPLAALDRKTETLHPAPQPRPADAPLPPSWRARLEYAFHRPARVPVHNLRVLFFFFFHSAASGTRATSVMVARSSKRWTRTPVAARPCLGMLPTFWRTMTPEVVESIISSASKHARRHASPSPSSNALPPLLALNLVAIMPRPPRRLAPKSESATRFPMPPRVTTSRSAAGSAATSAGITSMSAISSPSLSLSARTPLDDLPVGRTWASLNSKRVA